MRIVVFGGAGFIGSAVCRMMVAERGATVLNLDKLTGTSSLASLSPIAKSPRYSFRKADICDQERVAALLSAFEPDAIVHAAAERRTVQRDGAAATVEANVLGTWRVLEATREYWAGLKRERQERFRFLSVSSADPQGSAAGTSRAGADDLVAAWYQSYGLPTIVSKAADTFGDHQFPAEMVPSAIIGAIKGAPVMNHSDEPRAWVHIDDHVRALALMIEKGTPGATYTVSGRGRLVPSAMAERVRQLVERHTPRPVVGPRLQALTQVVAAKAPEVAVKAEVSSGVARLEQDTGWRAQETVETALAKTVRWYHGNEAWWRPLVAAGNASQTYGLLRIA